MFVDTEEELPGTLTTFCPEASTSQSKSMASGPGLYLLEEQVGPEDSWQQCPACLAS